MPETLKEWKVAITSVEQGYESTEGRHNYKTGTGTTYGGRGQPMDIGKSNDNFKDRKPKCLNMDTWQRNANQKRRNAKQGHVSNTRRKSISPETAKGSRR